MVQKRTSDIFKVLPKMSLGVNNIWYKELPCNRGDHLSIKPFNSQGNVRKLTRSQGVVREYCLTFGATPVFNSIVVALYA